MYFIFKRTMIDSFQASGDFCRLLITFASNLDPDQDRQNVNSDILIWIQTIWHSDSVSQRFFFLGNNNFEKCQQTTINMKSYSACKELKHGAIHFDCDRIDDWLPICLPGYLYLIMSKSIDNADDLIIKVSCNGLAMDGVLFSDILINNIENPTLLQTKQ